MKTLTKKLKSGARTCALFTSLAVFGGGCAGLATAIYEDSPFGEVDMARQRAKAPKIIVNEGGNEKPTIINEREFVPWAKSYRWNDKNMNGEMDIDENNESNNELSKEGISDIFKKGEPIALLFTYQPRNYLSGKDLNLKVFDSNNSLVAEFINENIKDEKNSKKVTLFMYTLRNLKKGKYTSEFYSENKLLGSHTFRVEE